MHDGLTHRATEIIDTMPTLSMFFGIVIRMFYAPKEHHPPHVHAIYQGAEYVLFRKKSGSER